MIAWMIEETKGFAVVMKDRNVPFRALDHDLYFIHDGDHYHLRLPHGVQYETRSLIIHQATTSIQDMHSQKRCVICYSLYDHFYDQFQKYQIPKGMITIGSSIEDDIYLADHHLTACHFTLDFQSQQFMDHNASSMLAINGRIQNTCMLRDGDQIHVMNLQILIFSDFLMINQVENVTIRLNPFVLPAAAPIPPIEPLHITQEYRSVQLRKEVQFDLEEPMQDERRQRPALLYTLGPALTMSSASLCAGMLSVYHGYLNGREIIELVPMILLPSVMVLSTLLWSPLQRFTDRKKEKKQFQKRNRQYQEYLEEIGEQISALEKHYLDEIEACFPDACMSLLFQKKAIHPDFLMVKAGVGDDCFAITLKQNFHLKKNDPLVSMIASVKEQYQIMHEVPIVISLFQYHQIAISGTLQEAFFSSILKQIVTYHHPDSLGLVLLAEEEWIQANAWVYCIPHLYHQDRCNIACSVQQMRYLLNELSAAQRYVVIVQKYSLLQYFTYERTALILCQDTIPQDADLRILVSAEDCHYEDARHYQSFTFSDIPFDAWNCYQTLQMNLVKSREQTLKHPSFYDLYQIENAGSLRIYENWTHQRMMDGCKARIGVDESGDVMTLDFHERAYGPHGLIAGMTGSGKSELLITMILSLLVTYSPLELQIVMIDFKGGGAAQVFANQEYTVPHIAGVFSNLNLNEMERALVSFRNEVERREKLFQALSQKTSHIIMNIDTYQKYWEAGSGLSYLGHLFLFVDEFAELKREKPDFMNELISIARVGRSLGIHLILSTQKPAGVVDEQIWSNSRFKICLKVQDGQDSQEVIHSREAAKIRVPGEMYVLCDGMMSHVYAAYSGHLTGEKPAFVKVMDYDGSSLHENAKKDHRHKTELAEMIASIQEADELFHRHAHPLWLPSLEHVLWKEVPDDTSVWLGKIDDYYHHRYLWFSLQPLCAVFSIDRNEKIRMMQVILAGLMRLRSDNDEIYVIDDLGVNWLSEIENPKFCQIFSSQDTLLLKRFFQYVMERSDTSDVYLIITDLASFQSENEGMRSLLHQLMENHEKYHFHVILMMTTYQVIAYRDLALVPLRIALRNENVQDLSGIFECSVKRTITKAGSGFIRQKNLLEFCMPEISEAEWMEISGNREGIPCHHRIPLLPDVVSVSSYSGTEIPLGMEIETCAWMTIPEDKTFFILATYEDEYQSVMHALAEKCLVHEIRTPSDVPMQFSAGIYFMTLSLYQLANLKYQKEAYGMLYVGRGFVDQYTFMTSYRGVIEKNMGVYYHRGRNQVIQVVEES